MSAASPIIGVREAAALLRAGSIVAFPTETVYGLAAVATDAMAVAKVFEAKGRPRFDPLIVHVADLQMARGVAEFSPVAESLAAKFWPGPLTLVLPRLPHVPDIVTAGLDTVGVRMPSHPRALELIRAVAAPLAAPSANRFGMVSPTTAAAVIEQFGGTVPVIDGGRCTVGVESTVVAVTDSGVELLRPGAVTTEMMEAAGFAVRRGQPVHERPQSPGQLKSHYSPGKPLRLLQAELPNLGSLVGESAPGPRLAPNTALLAFRSIKPGYAICDVLSPEGSLTEAATNLFAAMRRLGASRCTEIHAEPVPETGIGAAIMDRLRRAAAASDSPI